MSERRLVWLLLGLVMGAVLGLAVPRPGRYVPLNDLGAIVVLDTTTGQVWELSTFDRLSRSKWTAAPALPHAGSAQKNEGEKAESEETNPSGATPPSTSTPPTKGVPPPLPGEPALPPGRVPPAPPWQAPPAPPPARR